jgi:hypothetical protein
MTDSIQSLSEAYEQCEVMFCYCPRCKTFYRDNIPNWGGVLCPRSECRFYFVYVIRGLTKEDMESTKAAHLRKRDELSEWLLNKTA